MKAIINGKTYDTEHAEEVANTPGLSTDEKLFRTKEGEFFLGTTDTWLDGRRLGRDEDCFESYTAAGIKSFPSPRITHNKQIAPLTNRQAMEWCIKTQIPETFRGYLLDCL